MRNLRLAVAQLGPVELEDSRSSVCARLIRLMHQAHASGSQFVVFPELALTTFFPRHYFEKQSDVDSYFETAMPSPTTQILFETARQLRIGFTIGYAELDHSNGNSRYFNTSILVNPRGEICAKYRKVHLPGHAEHEPWRPFQHLEKRYFEPGDLGFGVWPFMGAKVGMCICNDRRWPETWRVLGLKGAELVTLGYNTPTHYPPVPQHDHLQSFHHLLPMQAGAYQNGTYIAAAAKAGNEGGSQLLGHSCIIAPTGEIIALSHSQGDELISAECDFSRCAEIKEHIFNFDLHRQPQHYKLIAEDLLPTHSPTHTPMFNSDLPFKHTSNPHVPDAAIADSDNPFTETACQQARTAITDWDGYEVTPLVSLEGMAKRLGIKQIFYKDEGGRFGLGSFKALGGAYAVAELLRSELNKTLGSDVSNQDLTEGKHRALTSEMVVSCATDGNHGRSVAWGAQRFGCRCVIYIHKDVSDGRKAAIEAFGAEVVRVDGNYDDSVRQAAEDAERLGRFVVSDTSYPGYTDVPANVMRGYTVLADEAFDQMGEVKPTHVFLQGGVGGFAAAITARVRARCSNIQPRVVIVEPDQADCIYESIKAGERVAVHGDLDTIMAGLACGEVSLVAFETLIREVSDVVVIPDELAVSCMQLLADGVDGDQPIVAGESAVAGLAGAAFALEHGNLGTELGLNEDSIVLVIGTEADTDPELYQRLVGKSGDEVRALQ